MNWQGKVGLVGLALLGIVGADRPDVAVYLGLTGLVLGIMAFIAKRELEQVKEQAREQARER